MSPTINLSAAQQQATQDFTQRIGLIKQPRSLRPALVSALAPDQIISTQMLEFELLDFPELAIQRAVILSEIRVVLKNKTIAWYSVLQLEPVNPAEQFMAIFDHYDYAHRNYLSHAFRAVTASSQRRRRGKAALGGQGVNLEQALRESQAGFLFNPGEADLAPESQLLLRGWVGLGSDTPSN